MDEKAPAQTIQIGEQLSIQVNQLVIDASQLRTDLSATNNAVSGLAVSVGTLSTRVHSLEVAPASSATGDGDSQVAHLAAKVECLEKRIAYAFERLKLHGIEAIEPEPEPEPAGSTQESQQVGAGG